jgi:hypothetical protein
MDVKKGIVLLGHALIGWALCAAIMGIGMSVMSLQNTLVIHAIAAPLIFDAISLLYFRRFAYTTPLATAISFVSFVVVMDFLVVALLIEGSLEMFSSLLGTWIPFVLIFASTLLVGLYSFQGPPRRERHATKVR